MKHATVKGTVLVKKEKESSKLRMGGGSWTINLDNLPELIDRFEYITEKAKYTIDREKAFEVGWTLVLQGEKKLVVPISNWDVT